MKRVAIIAPCILPVPASKGGAVEELITCIINQNEISKTFAIDLYTIADLSYELKSYTFTNIIPISLNKFNSKIDRITDKTYRMLSLNARRSIDKDIIASFLERQNNIEEPYYAVIVQNQMSTAVELVNATEGMRDYPIYFHMHNDVDIYRSPDYIKKLTEAGVQFIAISEYIKSQLLKYENKAVVHILHNGIDLEKYSMTTRTTDSHIKFLFAGRIIPQKGVLELVKAFSNLLDAMTIEEKAKYSLDIVGFSETLTHYERLVTKVANVHPDKIICHKRYSTSKMAEKYNDFDVVVMPTMDEEPFGLVALETIAKGIPLITTNSGAIPEVVGDGAFIIDKNNNPIKNLEDAIRLISEDDDLRKSIGKKGYDLARNRVEYNINTYYDRLVEILMPKSFNEKVSVIVPVYNVKNQLERCISSLKNQTYINLEIILVDDGSTDGSGLLCDSIANTDDRIKVIHQNNMGLSGARNSGINEATGEYFFFVDSDDYISPEAIEKLLVERQRFMADVMACGIETVYDGERVGDSFTSNKPGSWNGYQSVIQMMRENNICSVAWNKLYKSELWRDVRYPVGRLHEDEGTTYKLLYKSGIVAYTPECFYKYYQRDNSLMNAGLHGRYRDYITAINERIDYFEEKSEQELVDHCILTLLEYIKYVYRNLNSTEIRDLVDAYNIAVRKYGIPLRFGIKKKIALLLWRFIKYKGHE